MSTENSHWGKRLVSLLATVGGLWLSWTTYALIVPEPEDQVPHAIVVDRFPDSPAHSNQVSMDLLQILETVLHSPVTSGNQVKPLINGDEIFPAMLDAIEDAKHTVYLLTYIYWSGQMADEFATALGNAASRGVKVRLIVDGYGARKMPEELVGRLESSGVGIAWFHPFKWYNVRQYNLRTHRKVMIVDGSVAFTGGVGIADEWVGDARDSDEWRDDHFRIEGPAVSILSGSFTENWLNATGELLVSEPVSFAESVAVDSAPVDESGMRLVLLSTSPRGDMSPIAFSYWTAFQLAAESINITTPYFVPDSSLAEALAATARRGVSVNLLLPGEFNDSWLVKYASFAFYDDLINSGVAVHEYQPTMMHTKSIVIDGRWSLFGSPNFDNRSFELNDEILVVADDSELANQLNESFNFDISQSSQITLESTGIQFWQRQIVAHLALFIREQI